MKLKLTFVLLFIFSFSSSLTTSAQSVTGQILDAKTKETLAFATIQFGINDGVVSNAEGFFTIQLDKLDASQSFTVFYMGYKEETLTVEQLQARNNVIYLTEAANQLSTVYISNKPPNVDSIMKNVKINLDKNHTPSLSKHTVFTRETAFFKPNKMDIEIEKSSGFKKSQLESTNKQLDSLSKSLTSRQPSQTFTDVLSDFYILNDAQTKMEVTKATKLHDVKNQNSFDDIQKKTTDIVLKHLDIEKTYKLKSGLFKIEDSLSLKDDGKKKDTTNNSLLISRKLKTQGFFNAHQFGSKSMLNFVTDMSIYTYTFEEVIYYQDNFVYVVKFSPKKKKAKYKGTLYISEADYGILKADYTFAEGRTGDKLNLKLLFGVKYVENINKGSVIYKKDTAGMYYYPYYINQEVSRYVYAHRPFKFIENGGDKDKVSFDLKIEGNIVDKKEYLNLSFSTITSSDFNNIEEKKQVNYQNLTKYDASIWKNYNAIEPLEEMKQFKAE